jgi:hypothetical protein
MNPHAQLWQTFHFEIGDKNPDLTRLLEESSMRERAEPCGAFSWISMTGDSCY